MDLSDLQKKAEPGLKSWVEESFEWSKLPGDAGNRSYYRLKSSKRSLMLMVNAIDAFKSEEAAATGQKISTELDFVNIGRDWRSQGIQVPEILWVSQDSHLVLLEDFGDLLLFVRRQAGNAHEEYRRALLELVKIQNSKPSPRILSRGFSKELLAWEFEHFVEYALEKRSKPMSAGQLASLRNWMKTVVDHLSALPQIVCHRDYHSKNLIVRESGLIGVIDFQDALMGPDTYDLASLLRDSYVRFEDAEEEELLQSFESAARKKIDRTQFGLISLQRNMKAAGRFYYIQIVKGRDSHIPFVKPSLQRIFRSLKQLNEIEILSILETSMAGDY